MKTTEIIFEATSDVVFHYTDARKASMILTTDTFKLTPSFKNNSEELMNDDLFFLSLARSRLGSYHANSNSGILIKLDGRKLNQQYRVRAVDYWHTPDGYMSSQRDEMEDRLFASSNTIPALKYITEITMLIDPATFVKPSKFDAWYMTVYSFCKKNKIEVYAYNDKNSFITNNKAKSIKLETMKDVFTRAMDAKKQAGPDYARGRPRLYQLQTFVHVLYKQDNIEKMNAKEKELADDIARDPSRAARQLDADIHNNAAANIMQEIAKFMKLNKVKKISDLINILSKKLSIQFKELEMQRRIARARTRYEKNKEFYAHVLRVSERKEKYDKETYTDNLYDVYDAIEDLWALGELRNNSIVNKTTGYVERFTANIIFDF